MKGIVLAGGSGSRLWPITRSVSKQLLPVYDKPMVYYPISTLMLAGIKEILIITTPHDQPQFKELLGNGSDLGVSFQYAIQLEPKGLAQALVIGENFLNSDSCLMILGDNIFHGAGLGRQISSVLPEIGAHIFTYKVANPKDYGVLELDELNHPKSIVEKPSRFISNLAITGLYFFDSKASGYAKKIKPSLRNELEITSLLDCYLQNRELTATELSRGTAWLDTGHPNTLSDAAMYIRIIEERTGLKIACLEEIALMNNWITRDHIIEIISKKPKNFYYSYLEKLIEVNASLPD
jgi:glucose-1-phosphate thymidylyltransferase